MYVQAAHPTMPPHPTPPHCPPPPLSQTAAASLVACRPDSRAMTARIARTAAILMRVLGWGGGGGGAVNGRGEEIDGGGRAAGCERGREQKYC